MTPHRILGGVLAAITVTVLVLDVTAPAVFVIVAAVWAAFAVSVALVERREARDRAQVERMAARNRDPEWYREEEGVRW